MTTIPTPAAGNSPADILAYIDELNRLGRKHPSSREVHEAFRLYMNQRRNYVAANVPGYLRLKSYENIVDDFCGTVSIMTVNAWIKSDYPDTAASMRVRHRNEPVWREADIFGEGI